MAMHITGERRVPAPRERVWRCLDDPAVLQSCLPPGSRVGSDGDSLLVSGPGDAMVRAKPSIREPFTTLGWRIDPGGAATQMILIRLAEQGVFTVLQYEVTVADRDGEASAIREANLRAHIDQALERLVPMISGTGEIGAGGIATAVQAVTEPSAQPNANMVSPPAAAAAPLAAQVTAIKRLMNPPVIGGVLFLVVLLFMVGIF